MEDTGQWRRALIDATAGAIAGGISRTVTSPLDVIKIRFQVCFLVQFNRVIPLQDSPRKLSWEYLHYMFPSLLCVNKNDFPLSCFLNCGFAFFVPLIFWTWYLVWPSFWILIGLFFVTVTCFLDSLCSHFHDLVIFSIFVSLHSVCRSILFMLDVACGWITTFTHIYLILLMIW